MDLEPALAAALASLESVPSDPRALRALDPASFERVVALSGRIVRAAQTRHAVVAGEVAWRSRPELGSAGLAQQAGHRTPEAMIRASGLTARDASTAVRVGRTVHDAAKIADLASGVVPPDPRPWLAAIGLAVAAGRLSVQAAEAVSSGVGSPSEVVSAEALGAIVARLVEAAADLEPDRLWRLARDARDELDDEGVAEREEQRRQRRSLTVYRQPDGMVRLVWLMDTETAAVVCDLLDRANSPRRGGPRFVSAPGRAGRNAELARRIEADERSTEQIASDTFAQLLQAGSTVDDGQLLGSGGAVVRVLVSEADARNRRGRAFLDGQSEAVSVATAERLACSGASSELVFSPEGHPLDLGREKRLFNRAQRRALAARDGGCRWPGCDRPASWTEAHHVQFWKRDNGSTDIADGILFCRHHHLLLHNFGWEIRRSGSRYWLIPPTTVDPDRQPRNMPSRSRAYLSLMRAGVGL
ncbi:HNH endonuclease [Glaciihabitans arcticus]|uniref:HNH endonuclease n=1 Tax=Glaciihabitans arcticus TaxID=2668039 RepID=A0A4V2JES0_9MICO|nr:HNH endonuclease signature motif containing protein [Glaciihabitans arcticus]TBN56639.1 HNH endonuclease [Glaciihabitans arcticus]